MGSFSAVAAAASSKSGGGSYTFLLLIVLVFVGFYFLMIRPQRRRQQMAQQQQKTLSPGAQVRTTAGMYATVVSVDGDDVILEVAPGVEVRYMRRAVMEVISPGEAEESDPVDDAEHENVDGYADDMPEDVEAHDYDGHDHDGHDHDGHDGAESATEGLADSHKSDKDNVF